jgi:hypothetical protein
VFAVVFAGADVPGRTLLGVGVDFAVAGGEVVAEIPGLIDCGLFSSAVGGARLCVFEVACGARVDVVGVNEGEVTPTGEMVVAASWVVATGDAIEPAIDFVT